MRDIPLRHKRWWNGRGVFGSGDIVIYYTEARPFVDGLHSRNLLGSAVRDFVVSQ